MQDKHSAVIAFIEDAKCLTGEQVTRSNLDEVLRGLMALSEREQWWSEVEYPGPSGDELQARYLVHEESDNTYALYLNVMKPGKKIIPHNHTTWACIAAVEGVETNYLYERTDDGKISGHATIVQREVKEVRPGQGVALLADDIHAVHIEGDSIRHLHMYGLALEKLDQRLAFDVENNTCKVMSVGVKTRRSDG